MTLKPGTIEESTIPDPLARIGELDKQIADAERFAAGEGDTAAQWLAAGLELPTQQVYKDIEKYKVQRNMLQQQHELYQRIQRAEAVIGKPGVSVDTQSLTNAKSAYEANKPMIEAITSKELSPFVELDNKGNVRIDVRTAINSGVSSDLLKRAGVSGAKQQIVKIKLRKEKEALIKRGEAARKAKEAALTGTVLQHEGLMRELFESERQAKTFEAQNTRLGDGRYMSNADFESLTAYEKGLARGSGGFTALEKYWQRKSIPKLSLPIDAKQLYEKSGPEDKFAILKSYGKVPENAQYTGSKDGEPVYRIGDGIDTFAMSGFTQFVVDTTVPFVYTVREWDNLSTGFKALSIVGDALFFIPFIGVAARGAKTSTAVTRVGRFSAATKGVGNQLIMDIKSPVEMVLHPVQTVKQFGKGAWNILENVANVKKLPEAVISNTYGTVRIPVLAGWTPDDALRARTQLLAAIEKSGGKGVTLDLAGYRFTFSPGALMRETGGLSHATPQGDAFLQGVKVKTKPGMPMTEQGIFVGPDVYPRFAKTSAFGGTGEMPTIFIASPEQAKLAIGTSKLYKSRFGKVAELEKKFPVDVVINEPKQLLYTRLGPELTRVEIMLQTPLSKAQILKLKGLAIIEDLKAPFKPALLIENPNKIKGAAKFTETIDAREIQELTRILERSGNRTVARNLRAVWNGLDNAREVTRRETMEATRGRGSARIGIGTLSVGSRTGAADPERVMFNISAEKIGRVTAIPGKARTPGPIRITNQGKSTESKAVRAKSTEDTTGRPRVTSKESEETTIPVRPRRGGTEGESEILRYTRIDENEKKVYTGLKPQKEARKIIREAGVAIAWRQGQLHGQHRYDVLVDPFTPKEEYLIIMGKRPIGAKLVRGPRSAYNSAQTLTGHLGKAGKVDLPGIMNLRLWPEGKKKIGLQFARDANISNRKRVFPLSRKEGGTK